MICKNCSNTFDGNFCNNCGQNSNVNKIDFRYLLYEINNSILQLDSGFFYTVKALFTRPGYNIRKFLAGKRRQLFKPLAFVFLTTMLYVLTTYLTGKNTFLGDFISGIIAGKNNNSFEQSSTIKILNWIANNHTYANLILIPLFSFASYLSFVKSKYNYFEHLVLNFYITGQQMIIYLIFSLVYFKGYLIQAAPIILGIVYTFWVYIKFFENIKSFTKILRTLQTYILFLVQILVLIFIIGFLK